jgi:hypothetical protein
MELIGYPNSYYKFDELELGSPQAMQGGGAYFAKIMQGREPAIVQFPRCTTKSGIVSTKRSTYIDLMYNRDAQPELVAWSKKLVDKVTKLIDEKKALWFSNDLTSEDIHNMFNSIHRDYRSETKFLIRASIDTERGSNDLKCKIYDESEKIVLNRAIVDDNILRGIIPLIAIDGVKFTTRSIEIELKVKQMMLIDEEISTTPDCLIKKESTNRIDTKSLPVEAEESIVNPASVKTDIAVVEAAGLSSTDSSAAIEKVKLNTADILEEVNIGVDEVGEDLSENVSDGETHTSIAISESQDLGDDLEEVTLGDLSDFPDPDKIVAKDAIFEVDIELNEASEAMKLKKPNEVYYEIYRNAKLKAKQMRNAAVEAYLEAKQIKTKYMLDDMDDSDEEELDIENLST